MPCSAHIMGNIRLFALLRLRQAFGMLLLVDIQVKIQYNQWRNYELNRPGIRYLILEVLLIKKIILLILKNEMGLKKKTS